MNKELMNYILGIKKAEAIAEKVVLLPYLPLKMFKDKFEKIEGTFAGSTQYKGFTASSQGQRLTFINTGPGSAAVGDLVLWLKDLAKKLLLAGSVGALDPELALGDYLLPVEAIAGEGFSQYLLQNAKQRFLEAPRVTIQDGLWERCEKLPVRKGVVYTIGALNAEENVFLELLRTQGVAALDMETSAFYAAAEKAAIPALALHYVSDLPLRQPFYQKPDKADQLKINYALEGFPQTIIDLILSL